MEKSFVWLVQQNAIKLLFSTSQKLFKIYFSKMVLFILKTGLFDSVHHFLEQSPFDIQQYRNILKSAN